MIRGIRDYYVRVSACVASSSSRTARTATRPIASRGTITSRCVLLLRGDDHGFDVLYGLLDSLRRPIQVVDDRFPFPAADGPLRVRRHCNDRFDLFRGLPHLSDRPAHLGQWEFHRGPTRFARILGGGRDRVDPVDGMLDALRRAMQLF